MILIFELDSEGVNANHDAKYLLQRSFCLKVITGQTLDLLIALLDH